MCRDNKVMSKDVHRDCERGPHLVLSYPRWVGKSSIVVDMTTDGWQHQGSYP